MARFERPVTEYGNVRVTFFVDKLAIKYHQIVHRVVELQLEILERDQCLFVHDKEVEGGEAGGQFHNYLNHLFGETAVLRETTVLLQEGFHLLGEVSWRAEVVANPLDRRWNANAKIIPLVSLRQPWEAVGTQPRATRTHIVLAIDHINGIGLLFK